MSLTAQGCRRSLLVLRHVAAVPNGTFGESRVVSAAFLRLSCLVPPVWPPASDVAAKPSAQILRRILSAHILRPPFRAGMRDSSTTDTILSQESYICSCKSRSLHQTTFSLCRLDLPYAFTPTLSPTTPALRSTVLRFHNHNTTDLKMFASAATSQRVFAAMPCRSRAVAARCQPTKSESAAPDSASPDSPAPVPETSMASNVNLDVPSAAVATPVLGRTQGMSASLLPRLPTHMTI